MATIIIKSHSFLEFIICHCNSILLIRELNVTNSKVHHCNYYSTPGMPLLPQRRDRERTHRVQSIVREVGLGQWLAGGGGGCGNRIIIKVPHL